MKIRTDKGFTMLEVLLVITLLSILFAIIVNSIQPLSILTRSEDRRKEADALTIYQALEQYAIRNNSYPDSIKNMPNNTSFDICKTTASSCPSPKINLSSILVPTYFSKVPEYSTDSINTGFYIVKDDNGRVGIGGTRKLDNTAFIKGLENQSFENIVTDGLVLHLDAGNPASYPGTENTWFDLSGNGNNGTLVNMNGANLDGANAGSLTFNGIDEFVQLPQTTLFSTSSTISTWINIEDFTTEKTSGRGRVFIMNSSTTFLNMIAFFNNGYSFETSTNSNPHEIAGRTSGNVSSSAISTNSWFHFSLVFDSNIFYGYINGIQTGSSTINNNLVFNRIGYDTNRDNYPAYMKGRLSNFIVYTRSLSESEIQQNFNATKSRFGL